MGTATQLLADVVGQEIDAAAFPDATDQRFATDWLAGGRWSSSRASSLPCAFRPPRLHVVSGTVPNNR